MVRFLIQRPIAVTMTFVAILVLGIFAMNLIPVSLMPDIDIPEITVQLSVENTTARELENTVVKPLRRQLMQVAHLDDITSESRNEQGLIHLKFEYGTDIDFAFIEVNEKVDRAMNYLPRDIDRPKVIKANASDIPVFYLNLTIKEKDNYSADQLKESESIDKELYPVSQDFVELGRFASNVIRKRIEQLPEVAMVDMSGQVSSELLIFPDQNKLQALGISQETLVNLIENNDIKLGNLLIRDGQYQYNIRFSSTIRDKKGIEEIYFKLNDRLWQLKDVAKVIEHPQKQKGKVVHNGQDAISFAVIKQSDARMADLKQKLDALIKRFEKDYPDINFNVTRSQTQLLDYSISNLGQSLVFGALLAFFIMFLFLKDLKAPMLIGITIPASLLISMLFFYMIGISINIISLSGIVLGVGMMVDNSIIVIDNITQYRGRLKSAGFRVTGNGLQVSGKKVEEEESLKETEILEMACEKGTNEVFRPMLSSVLTTCSVFIPLIFISGITGALFYDQAMAIAIGLLVSLAVSITLLPVYYRLVYRKNKVGKKAKAKRWFRLFNYEGVYAKGFRFVMRQQPLAWGIVFVMLLGSFLLYYHVEKSKLPAITKDEVLVYIDWNENIHIDENQQRTSKLISEINELLKENTSMLGTQQFILDHESSFTSSEVMVYLKANQPEKLDSIISNVKVFLNTQYPECIYKFKDAGNIFNMIFAETEKPLVARLRTVSDQGTNHIEGLLNILSRMQSAFPEQDIEQLPLNEYTILQTEPDKLHLYDVSIATIFNKLKTAFNENQVLLIADNQYFVPVKLGDEQKTINEIISELFVRNSNDQMIPLRELVSEHKGQDLKIVLAGKEGEYYPVSFDIDDHELDKYIETTREIADKGQTFDLSFTGSIFSSRQLIKQLLVILLISLALLYFILASQFESLSLPLIVLLEVPVDIFGALLALKLGDAGINLMSLIGIVVMSGIIINDSILKIDTINQLRREGYSLLRAIAEAGHRRLKPIIMTSLTTILALVPFLFTSGLGADLQRPLALAVIGGMTIGTLVSLYLVPLMYYYLIKK